MQYEHIADQIIKLMEADLQLRDQLIQKNELNDGYNAEMEFLHNTNARHLNVIIDEIGYPTITKVGKPASEAAWLIIQHAISLPRFMKKCAIMLEKAVEEQQADAKNLAYLLDRIAVFEGKPQLYGTSFDWDKSGELSPNAYDDIILVNERRRAIGLNTLEAQTVLIRHRAREENESTPPDYKKRQKAYDAWRKKVGWIN